jgi:predicted transcriptional regulator
MILDSEEVYQERGKKYRSTAKFMDKKSFVIMVNRLRKSGKEVEQIAIELGASRDDVNRVLKGKY